MSKPPPTADVDAAILADPLALHYQLKVRGFDFAKVARKASKPSRPISGSIVRAVVYGVSARHYDIVMKEIRRVLSEEPVRRSRAIAGGA